MGDVVQVSWADILRADGVDAKGYGSIPKLVMLDHDLSYRAKAIYAYLCSHAGDGSTAFPGRSTILHDLALSKDGYYANFKLLVDAGYISVKKSNGKDGRFAHNVYTLVSNPKKLQDYCPPAGEGSGSRLRSRGVKAAGYGDIPRMVMTDTRLSIKGKALYAYLASFAGSGDVAFPAQQAILYHLDIGVTTYQRAMRDLIALNYIEAEQQKTNGRFTHCYFYLCDNPDEAKGTAEIERRQRLYENRSIPTARARGTGARLPVPATATEEVSPHVTNQDMDEVVAGEGIQPDVTKQDTVQQDMVAQDTDKQDMAEQDTVWQDTTINNYTINSPTIINPSIPNELASWELRCFDDLMTDQEKTEYIQVELLGFEQSGELAEYQKQYDISGLQMLARLIIEASHSETLLIQGQLVSRTQFMNRFLALGADEYQYVLDSVARQQGRIHNLKTYYLVSLYNAKETYQMQIDREIRGWALGER